MKTHSYAEIRCRIDALEDRCCRAAGTAAAEDPRLLYQEMASLRGTIVEAGWIEATNSSRPTATQAMDLLFRLDRCQWQAGLVGRPTRIRKVDEILFPSLGLTLTRQVFSWLLWLKAAIYRRTARYAPPTLREMLFARIACTGTLVRSGIRGDATAEDVEAEQHNDAATSRAA